MSDLEWLSKLKGLGESTANKLIAKGINKKNIKNHLDELPLQTKMWLLYKPLDKIPHDKIAKIAEKFMPSNKYEISGSYLRETAFSGDIDILCPYKKDFEKILEEKHGKKWIPIAVGESKISGIFIYSSSVKVEIDLWFYEKENYITMLNYTTGSKKWNIIFRNIAKKKGFLLNQYGLYEKNKKIELKSEKDLFEKIGIKYKTPKQRNLI